MPYLVDPSMRECRRPAQRRPDAMAEQQLLEIAWGVVQAAIRSNDVIAIGPGWGVDPTRHFILERILERGDRPLVIDADGLNNLARLSDWIGRVRSYIERGAESFSRVSESPWRQPTGERVGAGRAVSNKEKPR